MKFTYHAYPLDQRGPLTKKHGSVQAASSTEARAILERKYPHHLISLKKRPVSQELGVSSGG